MESGRRRIGVLLPNGPAYFSRVFAGVGAYCRGNHRWQIVIWPSLRAASTPPAEAVKVHRLDGVIGLASAGWERVHRRGKIAFVNAEHHEIPFPSIPRVGLDEAAIGRLAATHFQERGLPVVAAVGASWSLPAAERIEAFTQACAAWCKSLPLTYTLTGVVGPDDPSLDAWVRQLPRPIGIFCWNDETAKLIHQACVAAGVGIPDDVAIMGVDNDETICNFLSPELTSIDANAQRIGYEAASLLDRLMEGERPPKGPVLVPPIGVITRASTDTLATDVPDVTAAVRFIREHAGSSMTIKDVLDHLNVSRRSLERQFMAALGRSPRSEILRVLVDRARDLLANTDIPIPAVARRCGYERPNHFTTMFRKETGQTPSAYRKQTRLA